MSAPPQADALLIRRIREGDAEAWNELIGRFEGRLLAYVESRTRNRAAAEDLVQETFIGFLTSLPNFDGRRPLEGYLFSIAAHKLTDYLAARRAAAHAAAGDGPERHERLGAGRQRPAGQQHRPQRRTPPPRRSRPGGGHRPADRAFPPPRAVGAARVRRSCCSCAAGPNKEVAARLGISEQTVANYKFEFLAKLRAAVRSQGLPEDVFPELYR